MSHRKHKYAAEYKQQRVNSLAYAGHEGRIAIVKEATMSQWHKRVSTNVRGFWNEDNAK